MALWSNLHGGFVFGLVLIAPLALDAVREREGEFAPIAGAALGRVRLCRARRKLLHALWLECAAGVAENSQPRQRAAADHGMAAGGFRQPRRRSRSACCSGLGLALWRGIRLPPLRIVLLLGLLHMALSQGRAGEILALLGPLVLAAPLAAQIGGNEGLHSRPIAPARGALFSVIAMLATAGTFAYASVQRFEPHPHSAPVAAVVELKKLNVARVFNDYDFGGYLIASGVAPFIDGRTELYGEKFFVDHNAASGLMEPDNLFRLLDQYRIEATLMRTQSAATKLLDHVDGWQKFYADDIATIHVRKAGAVHTAEPAVEPKAK